MGQKVHPIGIRLGIIRDWSSRWYAKKSIYSQYLYSDYIIRKYIKKKFYKAFIGHIQIERPSKNVKIKIYSARPGIIIGRKGIDIEKLSNKISKLIHATVNITIHEIKKPELNANLVSKNITLQLEKRIMFRKVIKRAIKNSINHGAKGIKIKISGRIEGAEIARSEIYKEGRIPLHTLRANIDYANSIAKTNYGIIGIKVWIFKREILNKK